MKRSILAGFVTLILALLVIPTALVFLFPGKSKEAQSLQKVITTAAKLAGDGSSTNKVKTALPYEVKVYRSTSKKVEKIQLEDYIVGVVAGEMPAEFEMEALKAQALAARTYFIQRLAVKDYHDVPAGAQVIDTVKNQVYLDQKQRRENWGIDYGWKERKVEQAVQETAGDILTYNQQPIMASFFSTSNGYTENSEDYWGGEKIPYLRSVSVPWDQASPKYLATATFTLSNFEKKLNTRIARSALAVGAKGTSNPSWVKILSWTQGKRINQIKIGDKSYSGREIREKLGLNSSQFAISYQKNTVTITTTGYGHGVGMSQWGANGMAKEGKTAEEIVKYFYKGIQIERDDKWIKPFP